MQGLINDSTHASNTSPEGVIKWSSHTYQ